MSLKYRLVVNNNDKQNTYGMFYAKAVVDETVGIEYLAEKIEQNVSVKRADVLAVLSELSVVLKEALQESKRVQIPYLGSFKLTLRSAAAADKESFNVREHIKGVNVRFLAEGHTDSKGRVYRELSQGVTFRLASDGTPKPKTTSGSSDGDDGVERP